MGSVSVIIPTYNRSKSLLKALTSLEFQTYQGFEIIIADDGSTDETGNLIKKLPCEVNYLRLKHSGLPAVARNAGIQAAKGEYIAFLDSDDEWLPKKLEKQVYIFENNPEVGLVCSNAIIKYESEVRGGNYLKPGQGKNSDVLLDLIRDNFIITSTAMVRRKVLVEAGIFSEESRLRALEDYDLWLRIAAISKIRYIDEPLAIYWDYSNSLSSSQSLKEHWEGQLLVMSNFTHFLNDRRKKTWSLRYAISNKNAFLYRQLVKVLLHNRDWVGLKKLFG